MPAAPTFSRRLQEAGTTVSTICARMLFCLCDHSLRFRRSARLYVSHLCFRFSYIIHLLLLSLFAREPSCFTALDGVLVVVSSS